MTEPIEAQGAEAPPQPATVTVAVLDAAGIYQGTAQIAEADLTEEHVRLDDGCDLPPDAYRWDRDRRTFIHIGRATARVVEAPNTLNAVAWGFLAMRQAGTALPAKTLRWIDWYVGTIDFAGSWENQDEAALVANYRRERGIA
jgi:hypothetical protein